MPAGNYYVVKTDLPPEMVNRIGLEIYAKWLDFALGRTTLNGRRLVYPTGRYAASIRFIQESESTVAIIADENMAKEAAVLEEGHGPIDLKTKVSSARTLPMHRSMASPAVRARTGLLRVGSGPPGSLPSIWAEIRQREATGFATLSPNSSPGSWIIPPMVAYAPALVLSNMAKDMARKMS